MQSITDSNTGGALAKVQLVSPHTMVASMLASYLEDRAGLRVNCIESINDAIGLYLLDPCETLTIIDVDAKPEVTKTDVKKISALGTSSRVAVLIDPSMVTHSYHWLECGATGVIHKSMSLNRIQSAIRFILSGEGFFPMRDHVARRAKQQSFPAGITPTEMEMIHLLGSGLSNKKISQICGKSESTVKMHLGAAFRKLGVKNRTEAIVSCRKLGLI